MCGIFLTNKYLKNPEKIIKTMAYRGPDNTSWKKFGDFTLGHNRLSIIDLSPEANQPMLSACGNYVIVFNGEIYNYQELRLEFDDFNFKTNSDTEVLLNCYIKYGQDCVHKLRGMFAFAILNIKEQTVFCARDRMGVKPLVYYWKDQILIIASEMKAILATLEMTPSISTNSISYYLQYLYIPAPQTMYEYIYKLKPGHQLTFQNNQINVKEYWSPAITIGKYDGLNNSQILYRLHDHLNTSVKLRMIADVSLGSFLSGGLDSTTILYYMQLNSMKPIKTYTLGFRDASAYDERSDAKTVSDYFHTDHQEILIQPDITELLGRMVRQFDEPFGNPTSLLIYELTRVSKQYATVALAGDGGDEVFGGYPRYEASLLASRLDWVPKSIFHALNQFSRLLPESTSGHHFLRRLKLFIESMEMSAGNRYERWVNYFSLDELKKLMIGNHGSSHYIAKLWDNFAQIQSPILKSSLVDLGSFLPYNVLAYGDAMSMANGFEVRFPLLDHKLVEFMMGVAPKYRIRNGQTKYLLRRLLKGKIPDEIICKPKRGLNPPMGMWLKKDLLPLVQTYLSKESISKRGLLNFDYVQRLLWEHNTNRRDRSLHIWALIVLEEWFRQYID